MSRSLLILEQRDTTFLLNSWALRVTIGSDFNQSQAFSRSYSSNWPNSLNYHASMAIGYSPRRPDAVIGTGDAENYFSLQGSNPVTLYVTGVTFCQKYTIVRLMTRFPRHNNCHIGKRSLRVGTG